LSSLKHATYTLLSIAVAVGAFFALRGSATTIAVGLGVALLVAPMIWMVVSAWRPAFPDRKCPKCGGETLRLLKPGVREGVRCPACGFEDPEMYVAYLIDVDDDLK
jgi:hypothetical protein